MNETRRERGTTLASEVWLDVDDLLSEMIASRPEATAASKSRRFCLAILESAVQDVSRADLKAKQDALRWVNGEVGWGITSFEGVCEVLDLVESKMRAFLLRCAEAGVDGAVDTGERSCA